MMLWGFNVSAIKVLVINIDPILLTSFRIFIAGVAVLVFCYFSKIFRIPIKSEILLIIYIASLNVVAHHVFIAMGLSRTSAVNTGLIIGIGPLLTMMLTILFISKKVTFLKIFGFVLGFVGVVITVLSGSEGVSMISMGDFMIFIAALTQAISFILISKLNSNFDSRLLTGYMLVFGASFIFVIGVLGGSEIEQIGKLFSWKLGLIFLFSAILATAFGHMIYNFAILQVGPAEAAIFINFNTFFALAGSVIFLGENIMIYHLIGLVLIVIGVLIGSGIFKYAGRKHNRSASL
jgi:drug/metabolite transporter (DMT)-like permease